MSAAPALRAVELAKHFGGVQALAPFSAFFEAGTITAVVGPNGAGKTTLLDCLSGRVRVDGGEVELHGLAVTRLRPQARARHGLARLFQEPELFPTLTVREMLALAFDRLGRASSMVRALLPAEGRRREAAIMAGLRRFHLESLADEVLGALSIGMSRVVALAALEVSGASVWLLDEPASGLARAEVDRLGGVLRQSTASKNRCVVMVEHDAAIVQAAADRILLLDGGRLIADAARGTAAWDDVLEGRASNRRRLPADRTRPARVATVASGPPLSLQSASIAYGKFVAVRNVTLSVVPGEMRCLIGTNGAGKSTIMRALAGLVRPARGTVELNGQVLTAPPHARVREHGIVLVAGGHTVFPDLTVADNLRLTTSPDRSASELFPELKAHARQLAGSLSGGEQQMLAVERALRLEPRYLLVDELTFGLSEAVAARVLEALRELCARRGVGVLLVEQDHALALGWSSHAYVLAQGRLIFDGPAAAAAERSDLFRPVFMPAADA